MIGRPTGTRRALLVVGCAVALAGAAVACGGDDDSADATTEAAPTTTEAAPTTTAAPTTEAAPTTTAAAPPPTPEPGLPPDTAGYQDWLRLNPQPIPPNPNAPHGEGDKNVYVSPSRADITRGGRQVYPYPDGTVVLKTGAIGSDPAAIVAVMRKVAGVDPAHGDWEFIEWSRSSSGAEYTLLAQDQVCWSCHMGAEQTDWVFTTLP